MMINQLIRTMLLALKSTDEYEVFPPKEKKRLEEIIAFVGGEEVDELSFQSILLLVIYMM